jgi:hypothetical protein
MKLTKTTLGITITTLRVIKKMLHYYNTMLSVVYAVPMKPNYIEHHNSECHSAECRGAKEKPQFVIEEKVLMGRFKKQLK